MIAVVKKSSGMLQYIEDFFEKKGLTMEEKIKVQMSAEALFDFTLFHTYSKFSGFLTNVLGVAVIFMGIVMLLMDKATWSQLIIYIVAGMVFLAYTPLLIKYRAKRLVESKEEYKQQVEYLFNESGITALRNEKSVCYLWDEIQKVVATPKTIGYYFEEDKAIIIPKNSFGNKFVPIMKIVATHIPQQRIKIR